MTLRETTIAKLQQLPDPLLHVVDRFIDTLLDSHGDRAVLKQPEEVDLSIVPDRKSEQSDREPQEIHDLATPYNCFGAAEVLMEALQKHNAVAERP